MLAARAAASAERKWLSGIPIHYRSPLPGMVPAHYRAVDSFQEGMKPTRIGFVGPSGSGKTMAMAILLLHVRPGSFLWISACDLREACTQAAITDDRSWSELVTKAKRCGLLCIDDVSQVKFTASFASELFSILEHRNSKRLGVIWTSQHSLPSLRQKIADQCNDREQATAISLSLIHI
jgi:DNA replication protein DnaC